VALGVLGSAVLLQFSANKNTLKVIGGLIATAEEHVAKLQTNPPNDPNRDKWKDEARAALDRAKRLAERLPGKAKEVVLQMIRTVEGALKLQ
jgi:hypothetical protein